MGVLSGRQFFVLAVLPLFALAAPEPQPLKFPESSSDPIAAASTSKEQGSRDATRVIEEILDAARAGRHVDLQVGNTDLDTLASDPELKKTLDSKSAPEIQGRNYVANKLCALGLAKCGGGEQRNYGGGGVHGGIQGIRDVTLVQPVALKPIGHPIAAIPLSGSSRPFSSVDRGHKSYDVPPSLYPSESQGGLIQSGNSGCTCVPVSQCNSYDIVSGNSNNYPSNNYPSNNYPSNNYPSNNYPSNNYPSGGSNNFYPTQNQNYPSQNHNQGFITGTGRPSYGQVGHGIDPRNKLDGSIESNATIVEAPSELNARALPESADETEQVSKNKTRVTRETPRVVSSGSGFNNRVQCYDRQVCCRNPTRPIDRNPSYPNNNNNNNNNNYYPHGNNGGNGNGVCGKRNAYGINGRVLTGGQSNYGIGNGDTEFGEYPWQVAILRKDGADNVFVCGGSLINSNHVLTAAHCIQSHRPQILRVRLGDWDVGGETEFYQHQDLNVAAVAIHPNYNSGNLFNDIAIVKLDGYVNSAPHISNICLPDKYNEFSGKRCIVTGWGKDAWGQEGKFQHRLKEVDVPVLNHYDCEQKLKRTRLGQNFVLHPGFLCAGGEASRDACKGDGGGPLACEVNGVWQLAGIISWGVGCGQQDVPGVYVKVSNYHDWISQNIGR